MRQALQMRLVLRFCVLLLACDAGGRLRCRLLFSYEILTPAALNFFVTYADGAVESLWSIDQYFEFVLVLMLSTGLSFQVGPSTLSWLPVTISSHQGMKDLKRPVQSWADNVGSNAGGCAASAPVWSLHAFVRPCRGSESFCRCPSYRYCLATLA